VRGGRQAVNTVVPAPVAGTTALKFLEQGRERRPSRRVVDGLSAALLLDRAASQYLRGLAAADDEDGEKARRVPAALPCGILTSPASAAAS
jgi:hypothetical protein